MNKFLNKTILFSVIVLATSLPLAFLADGYSDSSYMRFTTPKQTSLILGTSRSATGIVPQVLDTSLAGIYPSLKTNNFSFTLLQTPYGKIYYNALRKKLDPSARNSLFILAVDPWSVSSWQTWPDDLKDIAEKKLAPGNMHFFSMQPNFEYLIKNYSEPYFKLIQNRISGIKSPFFLHANGWFEVSISMDSALVAKRTKEELYKYNEEYFPSNKLSAFRLEYLSKTIQLLKEHGDVILVRIPVSHAILDLENKFQPAFDSTITVLSRETATPYLNFKDLGDNYTYTDGVHLEKNSARKLTLDIAEQIQKIKAAADK